MIGQVRISLVVAMSENAVIGRNGGLPWHIRSDLKKFKEVTHSKPIIMGSTTWESLPRKPLPGRLNLVLTRDPTFVAEGGIVCNSLHEALDIAREHAVEDGAPAADMPEICVIGGANIFEQMLPRATRLYVSEVQATVEGDTVFPPIDPAVWKVVSSEAVPQAEGDDHAFVFKVYERV